jgi:hypothetical protein
MYLPHFAAANGRIESRSDSVSALLQGPGKPEGMVVKAFEGVLVHRFGFNLTLIL